MDSRALDFDSKIAIVPMANEAEDAERFATAMKYPPLGKRSLDTTLGATAIRW